VNPAVIFSKQSQAGNDSDTFENSAKLLPLAGVLKIALVSLLPRTTKIKRPEPCRIALTAQIPLSLSNVYLSVQMPGRDDIII